MMRPFLVVWTLFVPLACTYVEPSDELCQPSEAYPCHECEKPEPGDPREYVGVKKCSADGKSFDACEQCAPQQPEAGSSSGWDAAPSSGSSSGSSSGARDASSSSGSSGGSSGGIDARAPEGGAPEGSPPESGAPDVGDDTSSGSSSGGAPACQSSYGAACNPAEPCCAASGYHCWNGGCWSNCAPGGQQCAVDSDCCNGFTCVGASGTTSGMCSSCGAPSTACPGGYCGSSGVCYLCGGQTCDPSADLCGGGACDPTTLTCPPWSTFGC